MAVAFDTVESRELAWLGTDPPGANTANPWTVNPPPALQTANGGAFDFITAIRSPISRSRAIYVVRTETVTLPLSQQGPQMGGGYGAMYEWRHMVTLMVTWDFRDPTGQLDSEVQALQTAIAALEWRVRGPVGDKSHGGQFAGAGGVGEMRDNITTRFGDGRWDAMVRAKSSGLLEVTMTYPLYDSFVG